MMLLACSALALILAFTKFGAYKDEAAAAIIAQEKARIEGRYQNDIADLKGKIAATQAEFRQSEKKAENYREKLFVAEAKLRLILKPETIAEAKRRWRELGYEVR